MKAKKNMKISEFKSKLAINVSKQMLMIFNSHRKKDTFKSVWTSSKGNVTNFELTDIMYQNFRIRVNTSNFIEYQYKTFGSSYIPYTTIDNTEFTSKDELSEEKLKELVSIAKDFAKNYLKSFS
jgi:hypothetical protein